MKRTPKPTRFINVELDEKSAKRLDAICREEQRKPTAWCRMLILKGISDAVDSRTEGLARKSQ